MTEYIDLLFDSPKVSLTTPSPRSVPSPSAIAPLIVSPIEVFSAAFAASSAPSPTTLPIPRAVKSRLVDLHSSPSSERLRYSEMWRLAHRLSESSPRSELAAAPPSNVPSPSVTVPLIVLHNEVFSTSFAASSAPSTTTLPRMCFDALNAPSIQNSFICIEVKNCAHEPSVSSAPRSELAAARPDNFRSLSVRAPSMVLPSGVFLTAFVASSAPSTRKLPRPPRALGIERLLGEWSVY